MLIGPKLTVTTNETHNIGRRNGFKLRPSALIKRATKVARVSLGLNIKIRKR